MVEAQGMANFVQDHSFDMAKRAQIDLMKDGDYRMAKKRNN